MSHVQLATSIRPKVKVLERKKIWEGAVVRVSIPALAQPALYDDGTIQVPYLYFKHSVKGGGVNLHVLLQKADELRGKTITAHATVYEKTIEGGKRSLYVDFTPVGDDTQVTHRFFTASSAEGLELPKDEGWIRFDLPKPLDGVIAFGKPDATMPELKSRSRQTMEADWLWETSAGHADKSISARKGLASAAQVGDLASKFKVTKKK